MLFGYVRAPFSSIAVSHASVSSSPISVAHRRDEVLERTVRRRDADATFVLRLGEVEDRVGHLVSSEKRSESYTITRTRPERPTQSSSSARNRAGTDSITVRGELARAGRAPSTKPIAPGLCERNTSAGELSPSVSMSTARSAESSYFTSMSTSGLVGELLEQRLDEFLLRPE